MFDKFIVILIILSVIGIIIFLRRRNSWKLPAEKFPKTWRIILSNNVIFFNNLSVDEKKRFEYKIQEFLLNCKITGIKTVVEDTDRILIASSAVIPVFEFPDWKYFNLNEVLLYPSSFDSNFEISAENPVLGMVGSGYMEGKMILSKNSLYQGFRNETDKKNTAIHEFAHLIDKADGSVDGIPEILLDKQYIIPWLDLIKRKIDEILKGRSDINPYGTINNAEFFAVICEYFFERPGLLKSKHPDLYRILEKVFMTDGISRFKYRKRNFNGRNSPCPCGSGLKFKHCCGDTAK